MPFWLKAWVCVDSVLEFAYSSVLEFAYSSVLEFAYSSVLEFAYSSMQCWNLHIVVCSAGICI